MSKLALYLAKLAERGPAEKQLADRANQFMRERILSDMRSLGRARPAEDFPFERSDFPGLNGKTVRSVKDQLLEKLQNAEIMKHRLLKG